MFIYGGLRQGDKYMGMFDFVRCESPLPDDWKTEEPFQTKDFENIMQTYLITKEGRLVTYSFIEAPKDEPHAFFLKTDYEHPHDLDFHGIFNFYSCGQYGNEWHEYSAKFTDGQLIEITKANSFTTEA